MLASPSISGINAAPHRCSQLATCFNTRIYANIMARIFGIEIPNEKRIEASLPFIYGIGRPTATKILEQAGIDPDIRTGQLSEEQLVKIAQAIQSNGIAIEGDLRRERQVSLKRLTSINCYRGIRHKRGLPVRGQRTRTNARTRKGKKKTVGVKK
ncbi:MAG: ribosomal protein [Verrucomicrobiota bacterium]|jgi:small subunit ribosomal protein S13